jgi:hypothetical protein
LTVYVNARDDFTRARFVARLQNAIDLFAEPGLTKSLEQLAICRTALLKNRYENASTLSASDDNQIAKTALPTSCPTYSDHILVYRLEPLVD